MHALPRPPDLHIHWRQDGDPDGLPVVFANSLGTDLRLWDKVVARMPQGLRLIRYDKRGHGLSSAPPGPYAMADLRRDLEALMDHLELRDCVLVGLSIGGMIAQDLAAGRLDLVRALVLSNTAPKIGTTELWETRIAEVNSQGTASMAPGIMERWFSKAFRETEECALWQQMVAATPDHGYAGCCAAIAETDLYEQTSTLRLPTLVIGGSEDGSTPPDLTAELASLIPGATHALIRGAGHLPCVEAPDVYVEHLTGFLTGLGLLDPAS